MPATAKACYSDGPL